MLTLHSDVALPQLLARLAKLKADTPARWGQMNAVQMVRHLLDSYQAVTGEKRVSDASTWVFRNLMKPMALRLPAEWPKGVPTLPEVDQERGGTPPGEFQTEVLALEQMLHRFAQRTRDFQFSCHPLFGKMSEWEWMRWAYLHADHHLRQFGV